MPLILGTNSIKASGFDVDNSLRLNDGDSSYMHKTPGGAGDQQKFTFSFWIKRSNIETGTSMTLFDTQSDGDNQFKIRLNDNSTLTVESKVSNHNDSLITNQLFRDVSAWYSIIIAVDTTQGTASNRVKLYVNGTRVTSFATENYPAENLNTLVNAANKLYVGTSVGTDSFYDGYLAEFCLVDGSQLAETSFGEFDADSPTIWKPKNVSGLTFGTNGFYLDFKASGNLGNDANGGTDLTEVNLAAADQATDTCTNNFAVLNSLANRDDSKAITLSEGNCLQVVPSGGGDWTSITSTFGLNKGKWWVEYNYIHLDAGQTVTGIINDTALHRGTSDDNYGIHTAPGFTNQYHGLGYQNLAYLYVGSGADPFRSSYGASYGQGDIINTALNLDDGEVTFYKNGSSQGATSFTVGTTFWFFAGGPYGALDSVGVNFGGCPPYSISSGNADENGYGNFEHAPPSGFLALCTKNIAENGG